MVDNFASRVISFGSTAIPIFLYFETKQPDFEQVVNKNHEEGNPTSLVDSRE